MSRRKRTIALIAVLLIPPAVLGIWYAIVSGNGRQPETELTWLPDHGYYRLSPPSQFFGPGTINQIEVLPDNSLRLYPVCRVSQESVEWRESPTTNVSFETEITYDIQSGANGWVLGASNVGAELIKQVNIALRNMRLFNLAGADLVRLRNMALAHPECEQAIEIAINHDAVVCQTQEVVQADLDYSVTYQEDLNDQQKVSLLEEIALSLDLQRDEARADHLSGEKLFHGVRLFVDCIVTKDHLDSWRTLREGQLVQLQ